MFFTQALLTCVYRSRTLEIERAFSSCINVSNRQNKKNTKTLAWRRHLNCCMQKRRQTDTRRRKRSGTAVSTFLPLICEYQPIYVAKFYFSTVSIYQIWLFQHRGWRVSFVKTMVSDCQL